MKHWSIFIRLYGVTSQNIELLLEWPCLGAKQMYSRFNFSNHQCLSVLLRWSLVKNDEVYEIAVV
jgi:hypothetical protein